jgi:uncharacterized protein YndB with AHSA1/START domain
MTTAARTQTHVIDRVEKSVQLKAPLSRVWRALTDYNEFGAWFRVQLDGPFKAGEVATGKVLHPGFEQLTWRATIQAIDPEQYFAFTWHPYAVDPAVDYSSETPTLVEFHLEKTATGTLLTITESGFSDIPEERRNEAFLRNSEGWAIQMKNIEEYVAQHP